MIILDIPRKTPDHGSYVDIPVYHRTHLGLSQDTAVHYCLLPARPSPHTGDPVGAAPELIVAPFAFDTWGEIWRLTLSLDDKPGLLYEISDTMRHFGVSIVAEESAIMEERGLYHVEMIIHIANSGTLQAVEWALLARLFDNLGFLPDGSPRLRIRRVLNLWRVKQSFDSQMSLSSHHTQGASFQPFRGKTNVEPIRGGRDHPRSLRLRLPTEVRDILRSTVAQKDDWGYHMRISDTKDRFLRVLYFRSSDSVIHARVEHDDQVGAIAAVTLALREANFTLLTVLSTPSEAKQRALTEFVVRAMGGEALNTAAVKQRFEDALASSTAAKDLSLKVGYPSRYAAPWDKKSLHYVPVTDGMMRSQPANPMPGLADMLYVRRGSLGKSIENGNPSETDKHRWILARRLISQYEQIRNARRSTAIFISCHYEGSQLEAAKNLAEKMGLVVVTGERLEQFDNKIDGIIEKIRSCSDFLGIWSDAGAHKMGDACWPSPWLHWELGVAAGFKINWRLLISKRVSKAAWERLDASRQHTLYDETDFETKLRIVFEALLASAPTHPTIAMQAHYSEV